MFEKEKTLDYLVDLLKINSPTGYTKNIIDFLENKIENLGYQTERSPKGI